MIYAGGGGSRKAPRRRTITPRANASARARPSPSTLAWLACDSVSPLRFVLPSSPPAVHFDLPLVFDPLSKSSLSAVAQPHTRANLHFSLQIWARSHSVWSSWQSVWGSSPQKAPQKRDDPFVIHSNWGKKKTKKKTGSCSQSVDAVC